MRRLYVLGLVYTAVCTALLFASTRSSRSAPVRVIPPAQPAPDPVPAGPEGWFQRAKPYCNPVEVETFMRGNPAPDGTTGAGFAAACYALAGKIDPARARIMELSVGDRAQAASIVFEVGHPVADAGDDRSAGPIMELVIEFQPDNYMALYHAGMSEFTLGQPDRATTNLHRFLDLYHQDDGWRQNALQTLDKLQ